MAFTEFTCRSGGSNLYAGSLDGSAEASTTPLVTYTNGGFNSATGVYTPASGNPVSAGVAVGNWVSVYLDAASAPTNFVARVTAVSTTTITLSTAVKSGTAPTTAGTGITAVVGGAWLGPNAASGFPFNFATNAMKNASGNYPRVNLKNDQTYNVTAAMTHALAGAITFQGYTSSFGDLGKAAVDGGTSGAAYTLLTLTSGSAGQVTLRDLVFANNGASGSGVGALLASGQCILERVVVHDVRGDGIVNANGFTTLVECEVYASNKSTSAVAAFKSIGVGFDATRCTAHDNGTNTSGFYNQGTSMSLTGCVADTNGALGFYQQAGGGTMILRCCISYANGSWGVLQNSATSNVYADGCVVSQNGSFGAQNVAGGTLRLLNCAFYSNTSGATTGEVDATGTVTLTGDPFADAPNGDFSLNATAGAGAACRGAGRGTFTQASGDGYTKTTTSYPDIGAAQHQDVGGGGQRAAILRSNTWDYVE